MHPRRQGVLRVGQPRRQFEARGPSVCLDGDWMKKRGCPRMDFFCWTPPSAFGENVGDSTIRLRLFAQDRDVSFTSLNGGDFLVDRVEFDRLRTTKDDPREGRIRSPMRRKMRPRFDASLITRPE